VGAERQQCRVSLVPALCSRLGLRGRGGGLPDRGTDGEGLQAVGRGSHRGGGGGVAASCQRGGGVAHGRARGEVQDAAPLCSLYTGFFFECNKSVHG
jgi:hypothetical protein